LFQSWPS